ncbi:MAG: hypothetical protein M0P26_04950 [Bacteroidales bacterium]|nr:hypothetical protein [Bacteroidales bacterium]
MYPTSGVHYGVANLAQTQSPVSNSRQACLFSKLSHEVGHTLKLGDNYPRSTGGLMVYPAGYLISSEG